MNRVRRGKQPSVGENALYLIEGFLRGGGGLGRWRGGGLQVTDTGGGERKIAGMEGWWIRYGLWGGGRFDARGLEEEALSTSEPTSALDNGAYHACQPAAQERMIAATPWKRSLHLSRLASSFFSMYSPRDSCRHHKHLTIEAPL